MNILVTHPGRQHSHQLAKALHETGRLAGYWTGVPSADPAGKGPLYSGLVRLNPQSPLSLPASRVRHCYVEPIVRRVAEFLYRPGRSLVWQHRAMEWFDRWCARVLPPDLDAVVCYENAAVHTFQAAKERGATTILDAASFHHAWQDAFYAPVESDTAHTAINEHKDTEIALADHILTVSELARESYIDAGVERDSISAVPMGADLSTFVPPVPLRTPSRQPVTFLFVGHADRRKGVDTLLMASQILRDRTVEHRLQFAGGADNKIFKNVALPIDRLGYLSKNALVKTLQSADVLVLPSRQDSFGRVVVEAMATGLPALVTNNVGAKEVIVENENGWVVPPEDPQALATQMQWCAEHPEQVAEMQDAAIAAVEEYTWTVYRERVVDTITSVVEPVSGSRHDPNGGNRQ